MNNNLVSVIVPVYNAGKYLNDCIESIVSGTYFNLEIILIDDGSTDGSSDICDAWVSKDSRIVVRHTENGGVSKARNLGIKLATGDYIAFIDADDILGSTYIEALLETALSYDISIVGSEILKFTNNDGLDFYDGKDFNSSVTNCDFKKALEYAAVGGKYTAHIFSSKLLKSKDAIEISFDEDLYYGEDLLFLYKAIVKSRSYARVELSLYGYRDNPEGAIGASWNPKWDSVLTAYDRLMDILREYDKGHFRPHIEHQQALVSLFLSRILSGHPMDDKTMKEKVASVVRDRWTILLREPDVPMEIKVGALPMVINLGLAKVFYSIYLKHKEN